MPSKQATASTVMEIVFWFVSQREGRWIIRFDSALSERQAERPSAAADSLSLVHRKGVTKSLCLFTEDEDTGLAGKANFSDLPVFAD